MTDLNIAAEKIVIEHLGIKAGETVLVVGDPQRRSISISIHEAAMRAGAEAILIEMIERETHGSEPPEAVAKAMAEVDVVIAPTTKSLSHTKARKDANAAGARIASMPMVTEEMMKRALAAYVSRLKSLGTAYAEVLSSAKVARVTAPGGTDCHFDLTGREAISDDGDLTTSGAFGNLPAGEAFIAPLEGLTHGVIVFDGSLSPDGKIPSPIKVEIQDGKITKVSGGPVPLFMDLPNKYGPKAWEVAELGIGTNEMAAITGNILEDEKVASSIHVAFGNNATIGGVTQVQSHHDGVILTASLELDGNFVLKDGRLLLG